MIALEVEHGNGSGFFFLFTLTWVRIHTISDRVRMDITAGFAY